MTSNPEWSLPSNGEMPVTKRLSQAERKAREAEQKKREEKEREEAKDREKRLRWLERFKVEWDCHWRKFDEEEARKQEEERARKQMVDDFPGMFSYFPDVK